MSNKCFINPEMYMDFSKDGLTIFNYKTHQTHELTLDQMNRLLQLKKTESYIHDEISAELVKMDLIALKPYVKLEWQFDSLSKMYHFGTKMVVDETFYKTSKEDYATNYADNSMAIFAISGRLPPPMLPPHISTLPIVKLPASNHLNDLNASLWDTLAKRKSSREFNQGSISLSQLSTLLYAAFSPQPDSNEFVEKFLSTTLRYKRTSPSAGSFHPAMPYIFAFHVDGLEPGIYFYDFINHELRLIDPVNYSEQIGFFLSDQVFVDDLAAGIFITARFDRMWFKYFNSRAYRFAHLDIGHLSQTILLCATALGMNTWVSGAIRDASIEKLLKVNGETEQVMLFVGLGKGSDESLDSLTLETFKKRFEEKE